MKLVCLSLKECRNFGSAVQEQYNLVKLVEVGFDPEKRMNDNLNCLKNVYQKGLKY